MATVHYNIGNLPALMEKLDQQARREGNESQHELGVSLINLARERGMTESEIIEAVCDTQDGPVFYYP